jgi:hypothetical protein
MLTLPLVIAGSTLCFIAAYGIQRRKKWMWYAGLVFFFFAAGPLGGGPLQALCFAETWMERFLAVISIAVVLCLWMFWMLWWIRNRAEFGVKLKPDP